MMTKSSLKMMRIQPKVDAIKKRYANLKATDPKRGEMNAEMMALYKTEGVNMYGNPAGPCSCPCCSCADGRHLHGGLGMRRIAVVAGWIFFAIAATALAAPVKTQDITFPSGSETIAGYLAAPESPGKHPALVVIHEDWGLTDWVKEQTRKLAGQGYVALAVDLYRGQVAHDPALAYELMVGTPPERALRDMEAAIHFLAARTDVNKDKIGLHRLVHGRKVVAAAGRE